MSKKFYTCGKSWEYEQKLEIYSSIDELKQDNSCWPERGIYEIELATQTCVVKPNMFFDIEVDVTDNRILDEKAICGEDTSEVAKGFIEKFIQPINQKKTEDWLGTNGEKEYKWSGTCDACGYQKSNLTIVHSATLGGVTVCKECRMGKNEVGQR